MFIHIGYHKTATTWLQQVVFPKHSQINYLNAYDDLFTLTQQISLLSEHDFNLEARSFSTIYDKHSVKNDGSINLISWEGFVGDPFCRISTGYQNANRLNMLFPKAKILIVIRNQLEIIKSLYRQYIQEGGTASLEKFYNPSHMTRIRFSKEYLFYDKLISHYIDLFGNDSVCVLLYEDIKNDSDNFINGITRFLGVKNYSDHKKEQMKSDIRNKSLSPISISVMRILNHVSISTFNPGTIIPASILSTAKTRKFMKNYVDPALLSSFKDRDMNIPPSIQKNIISTYSRGNQFMSDVLGLQLNRFNYPLER
jgi:hypothetical protein